MTLDRLLWAFGRLYLVTPLSFVRASNILALNFGWRTNLVLFYPLYMLILELNNNKTIIPLQKILFFKTPKKKKKKLFSKTIT